MRKDQEYLGYEIKHMVLSALDYWCWNVSGDDPLTCYSAHQDKHTLELAEEFIGKGFEISEEDIEILEELPEEFLDKLTRDIQKAIERRIRDLKEQYKKGGEL